jgi:hypothetical protein
VRYPGKCIRKGSKANRETVQSRVGRKQQRDFSCVFHHRIRKANTGFGSCFTPCFYSLLINVAPTAPCCVITMGSTLSPALVLLSLTFSCLVINLSAAGLLALPSFQATVIHNRVTWWSPPCFRHSSAVLSEHQFFLYGCLFSISAKGSGLQ